MDRLLRVGVPVAIAVLLLSATAGCSRADSDATRVVAPDEALTAIDDGAAVIDVRTPEEFRSGHLPQATNIDVSAPDFEDRVGELDPESTYVVYCRSGNRSARAIDVMLDMGFEDVINGGGYEDLATGSG